MGNFGVVHKSRAFNFSEVGLSMINLAFTVDSAGTYITIPSATTGGQCIRFLRDAFSSYEVEVERVPGTSAYDLLNLQAEKVPAGSDGLLIPGSNGFCGPVRNEVKLIENYQVRKGIPGIENPGAVQRSAIPCH